MTFNHDHLAVTAGPVQVPRAGWAGVTRVVNRPARSEAHLAVIIEPATVSDPSMIQGAVELEQPEDLEPAEDLEPEPAARRRRR